MLVCSSCYPELAIFTSLLHIDQYNLPVTLRVDVQAHLMPIYNLQQLDGLHRRASVCSKGPSPGCSQAFL